MTGARASPPAEPRAGQLGQEAPIPRSGRRVIPAPASPPAEPRAGQLGQEAPIPRSGRRVIPAPASPPAEPRAGQLGREVRSIVAAITGRPEAVRVGPVIHVELGIVVNVGTEKLAHVGEVVQSGLWLPVRQRELDDFADMIRSVIDAVGIETVTKAADEIAQDLSNAEILREAAERADLFDMASLSAEKIEPTNPKRRHMIRWWILAGAILLAAGVAAVPIIGTVAAEVILTNELALAAAAAALAALLKTK